MLINSLRNFTQLISVVLAVFLGLTIWYKYRKQQRDQQLLDPFDISQRAYHIGLGIAIVGYLILAVLLAANNFDRLNPDAVSYLTIARRYAQGEWVVRGFWSPLISWLLALPIAMGIDPQLSVNILAIFTGLIFSSLCLPLAERFSLQRLYRLAIFIIIAIISLYYLFTLITPDLLGGIFVLLYFLAVTSKRYLERPIVFGVAVGIVGALAYYGKHYNIAFITVHLVIHAGLLFFSKPAQRKQVVLATSAGLVMLVVLTLPWIYGIYLRYDTLAISTSATVNRAIYGPPLANGSPRPSVYCWRVQLCDQPDDVLFPLEDSLIDYYIPWSPLDSSDNFFYFVKLIASNIIKWPAALMVRHLRLAPVLTLGMSLIAIFLIWRDKILRYRLIWLLLAIAIYVSGYMTMDSAYFRYYQPIIPLIMILMFYWIQSGTQVINSLINSRQLQSILALGLVGLGILSSANPYSLVWHIFNDLSPIACYDTDTQHIEDLLIPPLVGHDGGINQISYFRQKRTIGALSDASPEEIHTSIQPFEVNTLIIRLPEAKVLQESYDYILVEEVSICETDYGILRPAQ